MKTVYDQRISNAKVSRAVNQYVYTYKKERAAKNAQKQLEKYLEGLTGEEATEYAEQTLEWDAKVAESYEDWEE